MLLSQAIRLFIFWQQSEFFVFVHDLSVRLKIETDIKFTSSNKPKGLPNTNKEAIFDYRCQYELYINMMRLFDEIYNQFSKRDELYCHVVALRALEEERRISSMLFEFLAKTKNDAIRNRVVRSQKSLIYTSSPSQFVLRRPHQSGVSGIPHGSFISNWLSQFMKT